jgi:formate dehydrogenase subunit gamma
LDLPGEIFPGEIFRGEARSTMIRNSEQNGHDPAHDPAMVAAIVRGVLGTLRDQRGALLPILHALQDELGFIPDDAIPEIARTLNLTRAEVHGVVTFYHDFRRKKCGRKTVRICQAESCQAAGSRQLTEAAHEHLGIAFEETTGNGAFTLRKVFCLGNCALSPAIMVEGRVYGRVTPSRLLEILDEEESRA